MNPLTCRSTRIDLERCVTLPEHVWVHSGRCTVSPLDRTTLGVGGFHAPPFTAGTMRLTFELMVDGITLRDSPSGFRLPEVRGEGPREPRALLSSGRQWQIDRIIRRGHVHYRHDCGWTSLGVESELVPMHDADAFALRVTMTNRGTETIAVRLLPKLDAGIVAKLPLSQWTWALPRVESDGTSLSLAMDQETVTLAPGLSEAVTVSVHFGPSGQSALNLRNVEDNWNRRLSQATDGCPRFESNHEALNRYVQRCLITGMTCLWESPNFAMPQHLATSGIDGRAVCTYLWDLSYAPLVTRMMFPETLPAALELFRKMDISRHFAFTPDGKGTGPWYSANDTALTDIIWALACSDGPSAKWTTYLRDTLLATDDRLPSRGALRDFGNNHSLLEMRTNGYEHFVPCLNSLRARNFNRLADLCELTGVDDPRPLRHRADAIAHAVRHDLWNSKDGWFDCIHTDGSRQHVDSIQIFDVMAAGVATRTQQRRLAARIADGDFLGDYGVHSVSPLDEQHFELVDVDWSGNGAFIGEAPALAHTLWKSGFASKAWRVMLRLLWMGSQLPYLPQETYAQRPAVSPRGVANQCAALAGVNAIWFGMFGIEPHPSGAVRVHPHIPRGIEARLTGLVYRGRRLDISANSRHCEVLIDGHAAKPDQDNQYLL